MPGLATVLVPGLLTSLCKTGLLTSLCTRNARIGDASLVALGLGTLFQRKELPPLLSSGRVLGENFARSKRKKETIQGVLW